MGHAWGGEGRCACKRPMWPQPVKWWLLVACIAFSDLLGGTLADVDLPDDFDFFEEQPEVVSFVSASMQTASRGDMNSEKYEDDMFAFVTGQRSDEPLTVEKDLASHNAPFKVGDDVIAEVVPQEIMDESKREREADRQRKADEEDNNGVFED